MTREIKFRAWNKVWGMMSLVDKIEFEEGKPVSVSVTIKATDFDHTDEWSDYEVGDDIILQQYTGLKDKNGKEIFEGDIVKIAGHTDNDVVIFKDGAFCIEGWTNTLAELMTDWSSNVDPELIEVIGNVHENPELLKDN